VTRDDFLDELTLCWVLKLSSLDESVESVRVHCDLVETIDD
jgi:hypothetical protein